MEAKAACESSVHKEATIQLLRGPVTLEEALQEDSNIVNEATYLPATENFCKQLWKERETIKALVKHHLGLDKQARCRFSKEWIPGGFNLCIPIEAHSRGTSWKLMLRCAMPHKLAEARYPGTVDEKTSSEVGAYVWVQEKCPEIRVPQLYGFGFSDHRTFTHENSRSFFVRILLRVRRLFRSLFPPSVLLSRYTRHDTIHRLPTAYMLLENVGSENSQMLSVTFDKYRNDQSRRQRLYRSISRVMLSLARIPQPRIGSFRFKDDGTVSLTNRPFQCLTAILENDGTPRTFQKDETYASTETFVSDMLRFHDERFLSHPNMVTDAENCREIMAAKVVLRSLAHQYIQRDRRNGPFVLQLDDFHASNIFVDNDWNITFLIDLEWICALPVEGLSMPYWLAGKDIGTYSRRDKNYKGLVTVYEEFIKVFKEEERLLVGEHTISQTMQESWVSDRMWFWLCLKSTNAMDLLFAQHICPRFKPSLQCEEERTLSQFWSEDADEVVKRKVEEHKKYERDVRRLFI